MKIKAIKVLISLFIIFYCGCLYAQRDLIPLKDKNGKYGYKTTNGTKVVEPIYDFVSLKKYSLEPFENVEDRKR
jgi:hypothetical protein